MDTAQLGNRRSLTMPGVSVSVGEQIEALRRLAGEKAANLVRREPDPLIERIVAGWAQKFDAARAEKLGFVAERTFDEILRAYIEDEHVRPGA